MKARDERLRHCICPVCSKSLDAAFDAQSTDARPSPNDISVCAYCASFLKFDQDLSLSLMTPDEVGDLPNDLRRQLTSARKDIEDYRRHKDASDS